MGLGLKVKCYQEEGFLGFNLCSGDRGRLRRFGVIIAFRASGLELGLVSGVCQSSAKAFTMVFDYTGIPSSLNPLKDPTNTQ